MIARNTAELEGKVGPKMTDGGRLASLAGRPTQSILTSA